MTIGVAVVDWTPETADPAVGSFMPALRWVCERTTGPILELGGGYFSTPYLHELFKAGRPVVTYEFDMKWARELGMRFDQPITPHFDTVAPLDWSVVLIDCEGWNRQPFFNQLAPLTGTFVIHDSQDPWIDPATFPPDFIYRRDVDENPRTTLLSRTVDVREFGAGETGA